MIMPKINLKFQNVPDLQTSHFPTTKLVKNAPKIYPKIKPPVGPSKTGMPPTPPEKTGNPKAPKTTNKTVGKNPKTPPNNAAIKMQNIF